MKTQILFAAMLLSSLTACGKASGDGAASANDGPTSIEVPEFTVSDKPEDIAKGEEIFKAKGCTACHKVGGGKLVGPDLLGVTKRRTLKWVERQILKPEVMLQEDATAKELLKTFMTPMANQNVDPTNELPFIMAYLKAHAQ